MRTLVLSALLLSAPPAYAQGAPVPDTPAAKPFKERKICKRSAATESRMAAKKICRTAAQWKRGEAGSGEERDLSSELGSRTR